MLPARLDALENYVRGTLATSAEEKVKYYREATRINPAYAQAWLELGKTYYAQRAYEPAITALGQVQQSSLMSGLMSGAVAREANFYLGLATYAHGDFAKSEAAFRVRRRAFPAGRGIQQPRSGRRRAADRKKPSTISSRAIQNDPSDA